MLQKKKRYNWNLKSHDSIKFSVKHKWINYLKQINRKKKIKNNPWNRDLSDLKSIQCNLPTKTTNHFVKFNLKINTYTFKTWLKQKIDLCNKQDQ